MPIMPSRSRSDSWPPTQVCLRPVLDDACLIGIDDLPLRYFLTPPSPFDLDPEVGEYHFEAGIEGAAKVRDSPVPRITLTSPSQEQVGWEEAASESDDEEEYVRYPLEFDVQYRQRNTPAAYPTFKSKPREKRWGKKARAAAVAAHAAHAAPARGRATQRRDEGQPGAERTGARAWRQPSPYVWRIDEESAEELPGDHEAAARKRVRAMKEAGVRPTKVIVGEAPVDQELLRARLRDRKVSFVVPSMA